MADKNPARNAYDMTEPLVPVVVTEGERRYIVGALVESEMDLKSRIHRSAEHVPSQAVRECECLGCRAAMRDYEEGLLRTQSLQKTLDAKKVLRKVFERLQEAPAEQSEQPEADRVERAARAAYPNTDFDDPELKDLCDEYRTRISRALGAV